MPLLRTETGCKCRNTFVSITTTRFRRSRGAGWRKMLFQICELRIDSPIAMRVPCLVRVLHFDKRIGVVPLAQFFLEFPALVNHDLAIFTDGDRPAFERSRGRALEIDSSDLEATAVARALELFLSLEPIGGATEVSA